MQGVIADCIEADAPVGEEDSRFRGNDGVAWLVPMRTRIIYSSLLIAFDVYLKLRFLRQVLIFVRRVGYVPCVAVPRRYHEKILWRKIFDHNPLFNVFCNKLAAKAFIRERLPELPVPETLWVGDSLADAPAGLMGPDVVIKTNHGSSFNYFPAKGALCRGEINDLFAGWMGRNFGSSLHEWGYFDVRRKILIERLVPVKDDEFLLDISVDCANGCAIYAYVAINQKTPDAKVDNFAVDGTRIDIFGAYMGDECRLPDGLELAPHFAKAVDFAARLSEGIDYARFDFLASHAGLYAGEITVYPSGGISRAAPDGQVGGDTMANARWNILESWFLTAPQLGWKEIYARILKQAIES
jgi:hypothetical protein